MENSRRILLFQIKNEKKQQIEALCRKLDIVTLEISCREYEQPLGYLAGIEGIFGSSRVYNGMGFPTEMMVFSGIHPEFLDVFLQKYREMGIEPISLKAVLTPSNVFWSPRQLYGELQKEHMSFQK